MKTLFVDIISTPTFCKVFLLFYFNSSIIICPQNLPFILSLFLIVSKLNGQSVTNTAEGGRLHLPVVNRVAKEADAIVEAPLHAKTLRAEVINVHLTYVVGMKVDHLKKKQKSMILHVEIDTFGLSASYLAPAGTSCLAGLSGHGSIGCFPNAAPSD